METSVSSHGSGSECEPHYGYGLGDVLKTHSHPTPDPLSQDFVQVRVPGPVRVLTVAPSLRRTSTVLPSRLGRPSPDYSGETFLFSCRVRPGPSRTFAEEVTGEDLREVLTVDERGKGLKESGLITVLGDL